MQKHAFSTKKNYETVYTPLPIPAEGMLYLDPVSVVLPYAEDFPRLHYHDRYEIGICESGEGLFLSEGVFSPIAKGDFVFIAPNQRHYSRSFQMERPCVCRFAYLNRGVLERFLACAVPNGDWERLVQAIPAVIHAGEYAGAAAQLAQIFELCKREGENKDALLALKVSAFILEAQSFFDGRSKHAAPPNKSDEAVASVTEYLSLNYSENETAKQLAERCFLSESQLRRRFLAVYGMPPIAYRGLLRCKIAAKLLTQTRLTVFEIAERIGYTSPSDFYRTFKKHYGVAPSFYRGRNGGE